MLHDALSLLRLWFQGTAVLWGNSSQTVWDPQRFLIQTLLHTASSPWEKALIECLIRATPHSNRLQGRGVGAPGVLHYLMYLHKACKHLLSKQSLDEARFMILLDNKLVSVELLLPRMQESTFHEVSVLHWVWLLCESHLSSLIKCNISSRSSSVPHRALLCFFVWIEIKGTEKTVWCDSKDCYKYTERCVALYW